MCAQMQDETEKPSNSIIWVNAHVFHLTVAALSLIRSENRKSSVCPPPVGLCQNYINISVCGMVHISLQKVVLS